MGLGAAMIVPRHAVADLQRLHRTAESGPAPSACGARSPAWRSPLGPIVGGWLLEHFSWAQHLHRHGAGGGARGVTAWRWPSPRRKNPDAAGARHPGPGAVGGDHGAAGLHHHRGAGLRLGQRRAALAGFAVSAVLLAAFVARERRAAHPMLDVRLFRNMRFSAASGAVTVAFFTLFGFIFLITQYFQFVRGYSAAVDRRAPAAGGARRSASDRSPGPSSRCGRHQAHRHRRARRRWRASTSGSRRPPARRSSYGIIAVQMVLYGLGMGLTSAPATESIMGAVSRAPGGRRLGRERLHPAARRHPRRRRDRQRVRLASTASRLTAALPAGVPGQAAALAHQSVGAAYAAAGAVAAHGHPALGQALHARSHQRVPARPHRRRARGRRRRGGRRAAGGRLPARATGRTRTAQRARARNPAAEPDGPDRGLTHRTRRD